MPKFNLSIKTITSIVDFASDNQPLFAIFSDYIYFIKPVKLDKILSLITLLYEFNQYTDNNKSKNITSWLRENNLLTREILEECASTKIKYKKTEKPDCINVMPNYTYTTPQKFSYLLRNNLKNIVIFDFLKTNYQRFNDYVEGLIIFFQNKKECFIDETSDFKLFSDFLFEKWKDDIAKELEKISDINFIFNEDIIQKEYFDIKKINDNNYFEIIKENQNLNFSIETNSVELEKYLHLQEYINFLRIKTEKNILKKSFVPTNDIAPNYSKDTNINQKIISSNMSFLNINQIFYLNMVKENIENINKLFSYKFSETLFYIRKISNKINFYNYAKFELN